MTESDAKTSDIVVTTNAIAEKMTENDDETTNVVLNLIFMI